MGHPLKTPKGILTVDAFKLRLLQSKEGGGAAENFDSSDEVRFQQPDTSTEKWRQVVHNSIRDESVREDTMSLLPEFASM